ncbi:MAG TPA: inositol monophosphatase [Solirubrobacteraceae bacterium]
MDDLAVAEAAVRAAVEAARRARAAADGRLDTQIKGVSADVVTEADRAAEAAAAAVLARHRPADAVLGEEGTRTHGGARRRWLIDGVDGTVGFAAGLSGGWCSAVALEDGDGPLAAAVLDPVTGELAAAARGRPATLGGRPARVRAARPLAEAHVATFLRQDRLVAPGVRATGHALLDAAGLVRHAGPGSLELAWVAAGRLDGWMQPEVDPWDWAPGALLVREAGGEARIVHGGTRWHLAGPPALVAELEALVR